jgi:hypothetical protein
MENQTLAQIEFFPVCANMGKLMLARILTAETVARAESCRHKSENGKSRFPTAFKSEIPYSRKTTYLFGAA